MQKHVNHVDLVKSFPTNVFLQNLASIQKRTSPKKFAHMAEKSENGSISNLSTKVCQDCSVPGHHRQTGEEEAVQDCFSKENRVVYFDTGSGASRQVNL